MSEQKLQPFLAIILAVTAVITASVGLRADSVATTNLPITHVTLYTSGVGYFERDGEVDGDTSATLMFPIDEVNDVLKSLTLLDTGGGHIAPVTFAAQDPAAKQLQAFPIDLSDNPDRVTLLNRMRGADVTVSLAQGDPITGTVVGVETKKVELPNKDGYVDESSLNILSSGRLRTVALDQVTEFQMNDPDLAKALKDALAVVASSRNENKRPVNISFEGAGKRRVVVGYVMATPLWQTTYRLVLGKAPVIQGWAVVQNTSDDDWDNVSLRLVSGRPVSFIQDLYTPQYVTRPTIEAEVAAAPGPMAYANNMSSVNGAAGFGGTGMTSGRAIGATASVEAKVPFAFSSAQPLNMPALDAYEAARHAVASSGAELGKSLFAYRIGAPISIPRRQSAMIPFLSGGIEAEAVSIYDTDEDSDHPMSGARLTNTTGTHLMGGPLTVFDVQDGSAETSYVGDSLMNDTEPGQVRLISYAVDLAVNAKAEPQNGSDTQISLSIVKGVLHRKVKKVASEKYTFSNHADRDRTIVVQHPKHGDDWTLTDPKAPGSTTPDGYRFDLSVPAKAVKSLVVSEEHIDEETYALVDVDMPTLVIYEGQGLVSDSVKAAIHQASALRDNVSELTRSLQEIGSKITAITDGQTRIRGNMNALDANSALYKRYVSELDTQETQLNSLQAQKDQTQTQLDRANNDLKDYLANLSVE
jgi:small nuclear ribonucleoprotein (snRNP)-like protein